MEELRRLLVPIQKERFDRGIMPAKKGGREQIVMKRFAELLTKDIEIDIDEAFLVNVKFLCKVLKTISSEQSKWWVPTIPFATDVRRAAGPPSYALSMRSSVCRPA